MMQKVKYILERVYPYLVACIIVIIVHSNKINFVLNDKLPNALDGVNTMAALIIGFLGGILPVILGMKNESKFVKYVFEKDTEKLFLKYIKSTIVIGICLVAITISLYFVDDYCGKIKNIIFYTWIFFIITFLLCTYRSLSNMLNLIFTGDEELEYIKSTGNLEKKSDRELELQEKYKQKDTH